MIEKITPEDCFQPGQLERIMTKVLADIEAEKLTYTQTVFALNFIMGSVVGSLLDLQNKEFEDERINKRHVS